MLQNINKCTRTSVSLEKGKKYFEEIKTLSGFYLAK